eukprot:gene11796-11941_t
MSAPTEDLLKKRYAAELHNLKKGIQNYKSTFFDRQTNRSKLSSAEGLLSSFEQGISIDSIADEDALVELQQLVAKELLDPASTLPMSADSLHRKMLVSSPAGTYRKCMVQLHQPCLTRLLARMVLQQQVLEASTLDLNGNPLLFITSMNRAALSGASGVVDPLAAAASPEGNGTEQQQEGSSEGLPPGKRQRVVGDADNINQLLQFKTVKERDRQEKGEELLELLDRKSARQQRALQQYQTRGTTVRGPCPHLTRDNCREANNSMFCCSKMHWRKLLYPWTDESLGNCNFLETCKDVAKCRHIHYEIDPDLDAPLEQPDEQQLLGAGGLEVPRYLQALREPQWVRCDVRSFDFSILGKFGVIMTDPPWEIHQDLPYGTMSDQELLSMGVAKLQDDGVIFMWVTGRALELGRELLANWGYQRVDELIWVKTNSLQRLIRTGRTGHWLNHSKEHCLVGYKGNPNLNRYVDCDVVVSEVRETSRKPDEMYPLLERLSPGTRKLEIFARQHNVRPGWVSLGNQLDGTYITDPELLQRYIEKYGPPQPPKHPPGGRVQAQLPAAVQDIVSNVAQEAAERVNVADLKKQANPSGVTGIQTDVQTAVSRAAQQAAEAVVKQGGSKEEANAAAAKASAAAVNAANNLQKQNPNTPPATLARVAQDAATPVVNAFKENKNANVEQLMPKAPAAKPTTPATKEAASGMVVKPAMQLLHELVAHNSWAMEKIEVVTVSPAASAMSAAVLQAHVVINGHLLGVASSRDRVHAAHAAAQVALAVLGVVPRSPDAPLQVVALGTGTRFCALPDNVIVSKRLRGKLLLDSHAEVIARRSLLRWLYQQAQQAVAEKLALGDDVRAAGLQGALLGQSLQPVYVSSLTIACEECDWCEGAVSRAVCCRLSPDTGESGVQPPASDGCSELSKRPLEPGADSFAHQEMELAAGQGCWTAAPETSSATAPSLVSAASPIELWPTAMMQVPAAPAALSALPTTAAVASEMMYAQAKQLDAAYVKAKQLLYAHFESTFAQKWQRKNPAVDLFQAR